MKLEDKIPRRRLSKSEKIPGLHLDLTKKRYVFSKKFHGENMRIRFNFSKILTNYDFVSMINECRDEAYKFENKIKEKERKSIVLKVWKKRSMHFQLGMISVNKTNEKLKNFIKTNDKLKKLRNRKSTIRNEKKRSRFFNFITPLMKIHLVEDLKRLKMYSGVGKFFGLKKKSDYQKINSELFYKIKNYIEQEKSVEEKENMKKYGKKSEHYYINT